MFITPIDSRESGSPFNTYDPLLTNHLTNGQMGYLPNAQFMTPAQYGAFRTVPSGNYVTNQEMNPSLLYNFMVANRGFGVINTYNPGVNPIRRNIMAQRTIADAQTAVAIGLGETGLSVGAGMLAGGIGGLALGIGVGAVATAATAPYLDRLRHAREIQRATMSRITYGSDVAMGLGQGFNMQAAYNVGTSLRRMSAGDPFFNKEDYDNMFRIGLDSGMFDFANNADQYVRTLKTVQKNFKTMMTLFETLDMDEIGRQMKRMQAMGVSNENMGSIAGLERTYARMLGISHSDAINMYGQQGALIANNLGIAGIHGSTMNLSVAGRLEAARRTGLLSPMQISALGGVSGAAQTITAHNLQQGKNSTFINAVMGYTALNGDPTKINEEALDELLNSNASIDEIISKGLATNNAFLAKNVGKNSAKLKEASTHYINRIQELKGTRGYELLLNKWRLSQARLSPELSFENILANEGMSPEQISAFMALYSQEALDADYSNIQNTKNTLIQDYIERTEPAFLRDIYTRARKGINSVYDWAVGGIATKHNILSDRDENIRAGIIAGASADLYDSVTIDDIVNAYSREDYAKLAARGDASFFGLIGGKASDITVASRNANSLQGIYNLYSNASLLNSSYGSALDTVTDIIQKDPRGKNAIYKSKQLIADSLKKIKIDYADITDGDINTRDAIIDATASALYKGGVGGGAIKKKELIKLLQNLSDDQLNALVGHNLVNNSKEQVKLLTAIGDINSNISNNIAAGVNLDIATLFRELKGIYGTDILDTLGISDTGLKGLIANGSYSELFGIIDRIASDSGIADNNITPILNDKKAMSVLSKFDIKNERDLRNLVQQIHKSGVGGKDKSKVKKAFSTAQTSLYQQMGYTMYSSLGELGITSSEFDKIHKAGNKVTIDEIMSSMDDSLDIETKRNIAKQIQSDIKKGRMNNINTLGRSGSSAYEDVVFKTADTQTMNNMHSLSQEAANIQQLMLLFSDAARDGLLSTQGKQTMDNMNINLDKNSKAIDDLVTVIGELSDTVRQVKLNNGNPTLFSFGGN